MNMKPGHQALRTGRTSAAGQIYHVTTTTHRRTPLFADWETAVAGARALNEPLLWRASRPLCWVLMPDHWHALVEIAEGDSLQMLVRRLKSGSALRLRGATGSNARIWAKAFHDHALRQEEELVDTARYIVANPVRAGLCRSVREYPFWDAVWL
jgi:REP element-mobilizing transposase RayT